MRNSGSFGRRFGWFTPLLLASTSLAFAAACSGAMEGDEPLALENEEEVGQTELAHSSSPSRLNPAESAVLDSYREGKRIFRYETFGDETFWGDQLGLHLAIAGEANGGVGPGVSPLTALSLGLKVDIDKLPSSLVKKLKRGQVDLNDPATTLALLKLDAVIGVTGFFDKAGKIQSVGIQCALCHSVTDDSFMPGIGHPLDGWPNRDLNVGAIVATASDLSVFTGLLGVSDEVVRSVLNGWGPGKFDAFLHLDGKAVRPDGKPAAVLIPPLFDLQGVGQMTWNGFSGLSAWVPLVINLEMFGQGIFSDRRLADATQFPIAAAAGFSRVRHDPDLVTPKLRQLLTYVEAIPAPEAPCGSYDAAAAKRGKELFMGEARCSNCHVPPLYTLPGFNVVSNTAIGIDNFQSERSPNHGYRPPPLRGMQTRMKGGFFHDGRFATLADVVAHFDNQFGLALTPAQQSDLVEFLKTL